MGVPISQQRQLLINLKAAPSMKGVKLYLGARHMAKSGGPPRIVLFPTSGKLEGRAYRDTQNVAGVTTPGQGSIRDVKRVMVAHLWAVSGENTDAHFDELEDLYNRFFQALDFQATGGLPNNASATPGLYWMAHEETWDITEDQAKQGEEVFVSFSVWIPTSPPKLTVGSATSYTLSQLATTLSVAMGTSDTTASVASTAGFPTSGGILSIDAEQMQYTGIQANQFVGLVRGVNGTTVTTHNQGTTVNVT